MLKYDWLLYMEICIYLAVIWGVELQAEIYSIYLKMTDALIN